MIKINVFYYLIFLIHFSQPQKYIIDKEKEVQPVSQPID